MILATDDMRDLHLDIVHHIDQMKHRIAVAADDHEIGVEHLGFVERAHHATGDQVGHFDRLARHLEADCAVALVRQALILQFLDAPPVHIGALRLKVRTEPAILPRAFVPIQPQPPQPVENGAQRLFGIARGIGVFDAQDEGAARVAGIQPVEQGGAHAPNVQKAGGTGRESDADAHGVCGK